MLNPAHILRQVCFIPAEFPAQPNHNRKSSPILAQCPHRSRIAGYRTRRNSQICNLSLAASAPYVLQQTISLCQSVQGIVALAHRSYETAKGVDLALACESTILINLADGDLDRGVVLGLDDAVGGRAFSWDVAVKKQIVSLLERFSALI